MRKWTILAAALCSLLIPVLAGAQPSDAALADLSARAVRQCPQFSIFDDVNIDVSDARVTLTGRVTMPIKRDEIAKQVGKVNGVRSVVNEIRVLPVSNYDSDLRMRIAQAIYGHPAFWRYAQMANPPIHIIVENGSVTLTGKVDSENDRALACALAHVNGAFGVKDELALDKD